METDESKRWRQRLRDAWGCGLMVALLMIACRDHSEIVVFCAASLHPVLSDASRRFQHEQPSMRVSLQPSGSLVAARKISELGMRGDLIAVADADVIDEMLVPKHATWNLEFLANEIVIAHRDHSRFTDEISSKNWTELLMREQVRLGCTNPETAPLGYRTVFTWQLAGKEAGLPKLAEQLRARCADEHVVPDESELVKLLESRNIDYAFIYRSTAESHHLKLILLPPQTNLSRTELADTYHRASLEIEVTRGKKVRIYGKPITYSLTIPTNARNSRSARAFASFLLEEKQREALTRAGFRALHPAPCRRCDTLPKALRQFTDTRR